MSNKKILIVLTNVSSISGKESHNEKPTGFDVKSVAYLWHAFVEKKNMKFELCTPKGGETQMDPNILDMCKNDNVVKGFLKERDVIDQFKDTKAVKDVRPEDYSLIVLPGSHGSMIDFPKTTELTHFLTKVACLQMRHERGNAASGAEAPLIATIGHGIAALLNVKLASHQGGEEGRDAKALDESAIKNILASGEHYLKGKRVTCFSNEEERKFGFDHVIPYFLEDKLKEVGAKVEVAQPMEEKVIREGKYLVSAQNPNSAKKWTEIICELLSERSGGRN